MSRNFLMQHLKKSKRSAVIAERLFEYISLFGPPNSWVSDQGREFMGMCTNFSKIIGTEHRVTAAYNPRTNGLTERFNRTLCDALPNIPRSNLCLVGR